MSTLEIIRQVDGPSAPSPVEGERINEELKQHATLAADWDYCDAAIVLHEWAERFNTEFKLGLPTPAIGIANLPCHTLGTYQDGRNCLGLSHEITINARHLARPLAEVLITLLHEQIHAWQALYGNTGKPGRKNAGYHNTQFCDKARLYGFIVDHQGCHRGIYPGRFTNLLAEHHVDVGTLRTPEEVVRRERPRGHSKMRKFECGCTIARCATDMAATCNKCGLPFVEELQE